MYDPATIFVSIVMIILGGIIVIAVLSEVGDAADDPENSTYFNSIHEATSQANIPYAPAYEVIVHTQSGRVKSSEVYTDSYSALRRAEKALGRARMVRVNENGGGRFVVQRALHNSRGRQEGKIVFSVTIQGVN